MSTVATRSLGKGDRYDRVAIKTDAELYNFLTGNKWGVLKLTVASVVGSNSGGPVTTDAGSVDLRPPMFNENCDFALLDNVEVANNHTTLSTFGGANDGVYYFAVNNGVVGPAALLQDDNTYDLLWLTVQLPYGNDTFDVTYTVTYTLTFTDLTPYVLGSSPGGQTLTLHVGSHDKSVDQSLISTPTATYSTGSGYVSFQLVSLITTAIDIDTHDAGIPSPQRDIANWHRQGGWGPGQNPDYMPLFTLAPTATPMPTSMQWPIIMHWTSKVSGIKLYPLRAFMIFCLNYGMVDANGSNLKNAGGNQVCFYVGSLAKYADVPCNDDVTVQFTFNQSSLTAT